MDLPELFARQHRLPPRSSVVFIVAPRRERSAAMAVIVPAPFLKPDIVLRAGIIGGAQGGAGNVPLFGQVVWPPPHPEARSPGGPPGPPPPRRAEAARR